MKSIEPLVRPESDYYIYTPSKIARETFLYPTCAGHFFYEDGYFLKRNRFDRFLLGYLILGRMEVCSGSFCGPVRSGEFLLLDCWQPHSYRACGPCDMLWLHFDGPTAGSYFRLVTEKLGFAFSLPNGASALGRLSSVLSLLSSGSSVQEALLSKYLTDILTEFLTDDGPGASPSGCAGAIEELLSYISRHLCEPLDVKTLSSRLSMSPYHFIRIFKRETGFTPHQYVMHARLSAARYLLANTALPVKEICFQTGFSSESVFCTAFRRAQGCSPARYRQET